jgi:hypothetical protein
MIKITVDQSVEDALEQSFPTPYGAAYRALKKYINVVESMINAALLRGLTPEEKKFVFYSISTSDLANKGGQIGSQKIRVHKWLRENKLEIVETVVAGSKFTGKYSQVKLSNLVSIIDDSNTVSTGLSNAATDEEVDAYLSGDEISNAALFDFLYPEFKVEWNDEKLQKLFDWVPVDIESVKAYVIWLETESQHIKGAKKDTALRQALTIIGVAKHTKGYFVQRKKPSPFGRMYYEGTSVQNVNKELRRAMLGDCWEYDIRSSVIAWKMGFARNYMLDQGLEINLKGHFRWSLLYLEHKADFMNTVKHYVFTSSSNVPKDYQTVLLKKAFTAISFGARQVGQGWRDSFGNWTNPALVDIIKNKDERERFLNDVAVQGFIKEQNTLDDYLFAAFKKSQPLQSKESVLQTDSGRLSKSKVMAYLYQHSETAVMDIVRQTALENGRTPIANVHDAIFFKPRLGANLKDLIEWRMREQTVNPYWHLTPEELTRYQAKSLNAEREELEHKRRIAAEEALAKGYVPQNYIITLSK